MNQYTNDLIKEVLGENHPIPFGWLILLQPYNFGDNFIDKTGQTTMFERPDAAKDRDKYQLGLGRVLMLGDACYKAPQFQHCLKLPQVGEYVSFPKYEGINKMFGGKEIIYVKDYQVMDFNPDPSACGYMNFVAL